MARPTPLQAAAAAYSAARWESHDWQQFGRDTGTSDILSSHPRLYRALGFGDDDYPDAALEVWGRILEEAIEAGAGEKGRMELIADWMADLPEWVAAEAPPRTRRLFADYLAGRDSSELPPEWVPVGGGAPQVLPPSLALSATPTVAGTVLKQAAEPSAPGLDDLIPSTPAAPEAGGLRQAPHHIFIVHGHDIAAMDSIRVYVQRETGILPTSLAEEAGRGRTIIEKFEALGGVASFVIVLLTPDDVGQASAEAAAADDPRPRARQNVVLELGYFIGKLGRENVVVVDAGVERPSDLAGLSYVGYPAGNWKDDLRVELKAAELTI